MEITAGVQPIVTTRRQRDFFARELRRLCGPAQWKQIAPTCSEFVGNQLELAWLEGLR